MTHRSTPFVTARARRQSLQSLLALLAGWGATSTWAQDQAKPPLIADMHSHLGIISRTASPADLASEMRTHSATLVAWKIVADAPWLKALDRGIVQSSVPTSDELWNYFEREIKRQLAYVQAQRLLLVKTSMDVDAAAAGKHAVLLACEGADFLGGKMEPLKNAFDLGLRHLQLVHYIRNPLGDFQTESPVHNGLSAFGRQVVAACQERGILVDLAHCTPLAIEHALEASKKPMIWSHGWVDAQSGSPRDAFGFVKRKLGVSDARKIIAKGGVIGLWGLGVNAAGWGWTARVQDRPGYAREIAKLVKLLGPDHVALGTDMAGVGSNWTVNDYSHVREVIGLLEAEKLDAATIEKVAFGNFARVLKAALPSA